MNRYVLHTLIAQLPLIKALALSVMEYELSYSYIGNMWKTWFLTLVSVSTSLTSLVLVPHFSLPFINLGPSLDISVPKGPNLFGFTYSICAQRSNPIQV